MAMGGSRITAPLLFETVYRVGKLAGGYILRKEIFLELDSFDSH
jgi:hypothetical protein